MAMVQNKKEFLNGWFMQNSSNRWYGRQPIPCEDSEPQRNNRRAKAPLIPNRIPSFPKRRLPPHLGAISPKMGLSPHGLLGSHWTQLNWETAIDFKRHS